MSIRWHGTVQGNSIMVDENLGIKNGEKVEFKLVRKLPAKVDLAGFIRSAGAMADEWTDEDDEILQ